MPDAAGTERARALALRYLLAATAILLASGVLGILLRNSQADVGRLHTNFFYAAMTAHGLGAFVGWAGFACMGLSLWVLASVGFPLRRLGSLLAAAAFWLMIAGVGGILFTTLLLNFAASWVFLYPLPFHSFGQWGRTTTGIFSGSILLVGLSIIAWCGAILACASSPFDSPYFGLLPQRASKHKRPAHQVFRREEGYSASRVVVRLLVR